MDNFKDKLFAFGSSVAKAGKEAAETAKININIAQEEARLKTLLAELGKLTKAAMESGQSFGEGFDGALRDIHASEDKIAGFRDSLKMVKGAGLSSDAPIPVTAYEAPTRVEDAVICPDCGAVNDYGDKFCLTCGKLLKK